MDVPEKSLKEVRKRAFEGKAFQEEGTASAKALRQKCGGMCSGDRSVGLGRVSKEKVGRDGKGQCRTEDHQEGFCLCL